MSQRFPVKVDEETYNIVKTYHDLTNRPITKVLAEAVKFWSEIKGQSDIEYWTERYSDRQSEKEPPEIWCDDPLLIT